MKKPTDGGPIQVSGRWTWLKPNTSTHECPHVDLGACANCANPSKPAVYPLVAYHIKNRERHGNV